MNVVVVFSRHYIFSHLHRQHFPDKLTVEYEWESLGERGEDIWGREGEASRRRVTSISMCPVDILSLYHSETVHAVRTY
jgi:hypothetical protein